MHKQHRQSNQTTSRQQDESMTQEYAVVLERGDHNWSAYVPNLPGCIATGKTREETLAVLREAIAFHIEGMQLHGEHVSEPMAQVDRVVVTT